MEADQIEEMYDYIDVYQVGTRNFKILIYWMLLGG